MPAIIWSNYQQCPVPLIIVDLNLNVFLEGTLDGCDLTHLWGTWGHVITGIEDLL